MNYVPFVFYLPSALLGYLVGVILLTVRAVEKPRLLEGVLVVRKRWKTKWSQAIGHCILLSPNAGTRTAVHEIVHVWQYEDACFLGAILGGTVAIFDWRIGLALWASSGVLWMLPQYVTSFFRNYSEKPEGEGRGYFTYRAALFEDHAYYVEADK